MQYNVDNLLVRGRTMHGAEAGTLVEVTPQRAGWDTIYFAARRLAPGGTWSVSCGENELALVSLSGTFVVRSSEGTFSLGGRKDVFSGLPHALYLPPGATATVESEHGCEFIETSAPAVKGAKGLAAKLVEPKDVRTEIRGAGHATRMINSILPPGFPCSRLVVVEVLTPAGNWSSYPPHKHDVHKTRADGSIAEADLDEIYYYRFQRPEGCAVQRVYTGKDSPLAVAGKPFDAALVARDSDVVLVPEGYHPVSAPPGYDAYYLNVLAGTAQVLCATDDPEFTWVKSTYDVCDVRVPLYDVSAGAGLRYSDAPKNPLSTK